MQPLNDAIKVAICIKIPKGSICIRTGKKKKKKDLAANQMRNSRSFEGAERNLLEIKGMVLRTLIEWSNASVLDLLDFCIVFFWSVHSLCTGLSIFIRNKTFIYRSKKKKSSKSNE